jgi:two-component system CheB/CheR fusion protein
MAEDSQRTSNEPDPAEHLVEHAAEQPFPVVGIGASAGGLEAFGEFFDAMPANSGMAFVLVQHLPPQKNSLLAEILSKRAKMPVTQVEDGVVVEPDHAYVIRPGHTMTINDGRLRLGEPVERRGHRRPVDDFFRSLAEHQGSKSIVVILSGMGSNGTAGAQAVKASGGICIAQDPSTAQFPSMPQSLIDAGYADHVMRPSEMPDLLLNYAHHPYMAGHGDGQDEAETQKLLRRDRNYFSEVLALLRTRANFEFSGYKKPTLHRRIQRRMGVNQITQLAEYVQMLRQNPEEIASLANDLMINVTGFFRDPEAWEALRTLVISPLIAERSDGSPIRAWVTACASGEEPYTLAMLIAEESERVKKHFDVKIFATDAAEKSLMRARQGVYPGGIEGDLSPERLEKFFDKEDQVYRIKKMIREMVVFAPQNLLNDPPFSRLDIACCRNLLIYLEPEVQRRVLGILHFSLREGGCLFLGSSEALGNSDRTFDAISKKWRIFRRVGPSRRTTTELAAMGLHRTGDASDRPIPEFTAPPSLATLAHKTLLDRYTPPAVVIDRRFKVLYFHGATSIFLSQPSGEPTSNLLNMCGDGLRAAVRAACRQAMSDNSTVMVPDGRIDVGQGPKRIQVVVSPIARSDAHEHFLVCFEEVAEAPPARRPTDDPETSDKSLVFQRQLEDELTTVRDELQNTLEEMESSNEELKASNEEVTSINEELQSTNEELETNKEELQSLNEELTAVNAQLQIKIEELEGTTNDLSNLLSSTDIAVVFLDTNFRIRRYTPAVRNLLELIPSDVGRPLSDLAQKFVDTNLSNDAIAVMERLIPIEREVRSNDHRWYQRRALPYRTSNNHIDGVVITFVDITARKDAEQRTQSAYDRIQAVLEQLPAAVMIVDAPTGKVTLVNQQLPRLLKIVLPFPFVDSDWTTAFSTFKGYNARHHLYEQHEWPIARTLKTGEVVVDEEMSFDGPDGLRGMLSASSTPVFDRAGKAFAVVATFFEITDRRRTESMLSESEERFRLLVEGTLDYALFMLDPNGQIATWNAGGKRLLGYQEKDIVGKSLAVIFTAEDRAAGMPEREIAQASRNGQSICQGWRLRKDGTRFWANGAITRLDPGPNGKPRGFVKILHDDTEARNAAESLLRSKHNADSLRQTAETANRAKDDFVAMISHELRTPLSAILLWAKMLRGHPGCDSEIKDGLDIVVRSAVSQQQLIDDLLDVSRMTSGKLRMSPRPTLLAKAVDSALQAIVPTAEDRGVSVTSDLSADVGIVRADPERLQQVVWNLLNNAVKFTPSGGSVRVKLQRLDRMVQITVSDTGIGISPDFLPYVFERFRQADPGPTRQHTGLGLGLTIARQLVELHGGTITATSDGEGKGSEFIVRLPLPVVAIDEHDAATGTDLNDLQAEGALQGLKVLLVEDEPDTRDAVQVFLTRLGANVIPADSAKSAFELYNETKPDLIVSDIAMPGEDGHSLIRRVRAHEKEVQAPVIPALAISALATEADRTRAREAGFDENMAKPIDPARLLEAVQRLMKSPTGG